jgi:hypothetical protein
MLLMTAFGKLTLERYGLASYSLPVKPVIRVAGIWVWVIAAEVKAGLCILKGQDTNH